MPSRSVKRCIFLKRSSWSTRNVTIRDGCRRMWYAVYCKQIRSHDVACNLRAHLRAAALDVLRSELTFLVQLDEGVEILAIDQNSTHVSAVASAGTGHPNRRQVARKHQVSGAPVAQANVLSRLLQGEQARLDCSLLNGLHSVLIFGASFWNPSQVVPAVSCKSFSGQIHGGTARATPTRRRGRIPAHVKAHGSRPSFRSSTSAHRRRRTSGARPLVRSAASLRISDR